MEEDSRLDPVYFLHTAVLPSLTGGFFTSKRLSDFINVVHLYTWLALFCVPLAIILSEGAAVSQAAQLAYASALTCAFALVLAVNWKLHSIYSNSEPEEMSSEVTLDSSATTFPPVDNSSGGTVAASAAVRSGNDASEVGFDLRYQPRELDSEASYTQGELVAATVDLPSRPLSPDDARGSIGSGISSISDAAAASFVSAARDRVLQRLRSLEHSGGESSAAETTAEEEGQQKDEKDEEISGETATMNIDTSGSPDLTTAVENLPSDVADEARDLLRTAALRLEERAISDAIARALKMAENAFTVYQENAALFSILSNEQAACTYYQRLARSLEEPISRLRRGDVIDTSTLPMYPELQLPPGHTGGTMPDPDELPALPNPAALQRQQELSGRRRRRQRWAARHASSWAARHASMAADEFESTNPCAIPISRAQALGLRVTRAPPEPPRRLPPRPPRPSRPPSQSQDDKTIVLETTADVLDKPSEESNNDTSVRKDANASSNRASSYTENAGASIVTRASQQQKHQEGEVAAANFTFATESARENGEEEEEVEENDISTEALEDYQELVEGFGPVEDAVALPALLVTEGQGEIDESTEETKAVKDMQNYTSSVRSQPDLPASATGELSPALAMELSDGEIPTLSDTFNSNESGSNGKEEEEEKKEEEEEEEREEEREEEYNGESTPWGQLGSHVQNAIFAAYEEQKELCRDMPWMWLKEYGIRTGAVAGRPRVETLFTAVALEPYEAESREELSLRQGNVMTNMVPISPFWAYGEANRASEDGSLNSLGFGYVPVEGLTDPTPFSSSDMTVDEVLALSAGVFAILPHQYLAGEPPIFRLDVQGVNLDAQYDIEVTRWGFLCITRGRIAFNGGEVAYFLTLDAERPTFEVLRELVTHYSKHPLPSGVNSDPRYSELYLRWPARKQLKTYEAREARGPISARLRRRRRATRRRDGAHIEVRGTGETAQVEDGLRAGSTSGPHFADEEVENLSGSSLATMADDSVNVSAPGPASASSSSTSTPARTSVLSAMTSERNASMDSNFGSLARRQRARSIVADRDVYSLPHPDMLREMDAFFNVQALPSMPSTSDSESEAGGHDHQGVGEGGLPFHLGLPALRSGSSRRRSHGTLPRPTALLYTWPLPGGRKFRFGFRRSDLIALMDQSDGVVDVIVVLGLVFAVAYLGVGLAPMYGPVATVVLSLVMGAAHYSLLKSTQPSPNTSTVGERAAGTGRALYFCLNAGLVHLCSFMSEVEQGKVTGTAANGTLHVYAPSTVPPQLYGVPLADPGLWGVSRDVFLATILAMPIIFLFGYLPVWRTAVHWLLEQIDMHILGGGGTTGHVAAAITVARGAIAVAACAGAAWALFGANSGNTTSSATNSEVTAPGTLFALYCGMLWSFATLLARVPADMWSYYYGCLGRDRSRGKLDEAVKLNASAMGTEVKADSGAASDDTAVSEGVASSVSGIGSSATGPTAATTAVDTAAVEAAGETSLFTPLPSSSEDKFAALRRARAIYDIAFSILAFGAGSFLHYAGLFARAPGNVTAPALKISLTVIVAAAGWLCEYVLPQARRAQPFGILANPLLSTKQGIMRCEALQNAISMLGYGIFAPVLILSMVCDSAAMLTNRWGFGVAAALLSVSGIKLLRQALRGDADFYLAVLGALAYRLSYSGASTLAETGGSAAAGAVDQHQDHGETEILDLFFSSVLVAKLREFLLKLGFILTYNVPWNIKDIWGSSLHVVLAVMAVPHTAFAMLQIALSCLVSAPIYPVLGSAVFMVSYFRPVRFWERDYTTRRADVTNTRLDAHATGGGEEATANNLNSLFYRHMLGKLEQVLATDVSAGRYGSVNVGDVFVLADSGNSMNAFLHIVERGAGYVSFQLRGLEFAGTFCQAREVEALASDPASDRGFLHRSFERDPAPFLSPNASVRLRMQTWQHTNPQLQLPGYSIARTRAEQMFNISNDLTETMYRRIAEATAYRLLTAPELSDWLADPAVEAAIAPIGPGYVDRDRFYARHMGKIRVSCRTLCRRGALSYDKFFEVHGPWISHVTGTTDSALATSPSSRLCFALIALVYRLIGDAARPSASARDHDSPFFLRGYAALFSGVAQPEYTADQWIYSVIAIIERVVLPAGRIALVLYEDSFVDPYAYSDLEVLQDSLVSIESRTAPEHVVVCPETDPQWRTSVLADKPALLSFRFNIEDSSYNREYFVIRLTRCVRKLQVFRVNRESVRGFWAGQQQEVLFFRNPHNERGSIQNAKTVLRNMINQSCDQPVGYPNFVSPLVTSFEPGLGSSFAVLKLFPPALVALVKNVASMPKQAAVALRKACSRLNFGRNSGAGSDLDTVSSGDANQTVEAIVLEDIVTSSEGNSDAMDTTSATTAHTIMAETTPIGLPEGLSFPPNIARTAALMLSRIPMPEVRHRVVRAQDLCEVAEALLGDAVALNTEYAGLERGSLFQRTVGKSPANQHCNRDNESVPFDHTRVKLQCVSSPISTVTKGEHTVSAVPVTSTSYYGAVRIMGHASTISTEAAATEITTLPAAAAAAAAATTTTTTTDGGDRGDTVNAYHEDSASAGPGSNCGDFATTATPTVASGDGGAPLATIPLPIVNEGTAGILVDTVTNSTGGYSNGQSDYINASLVAGVNGEMAYIAAMSPKPSTIDAFWRMVWQCRAEAIVMVGRAGPSMPGMGHIGCAPYWPAEHLASQEGSGGGLPCPALLTDSGIFVAHIAEEKVHVGDEPVALCTVTTLRLRYRDEARLISHFRLSGQLLGLEEEKANATSAEGQQEPFSHELVASATLDMLRRVRNCVAPQRAPIVVHATAGTAAAGTLLAVDMNLHILANEGSVDVFGVVNRLRRQLPDAVDTSARYALIYRLLAAAHACEDVLAAFKASPVGGEVNSNRSLQPQKKWAGDIAMYTTTAATGIISTTNLASDTSSEGGGRRNYIAEGEEAVVGRQPGSDLRQGQQESFSEEGGVQDPLGPPAATSDFAYSLRTAREHTRQALAALRHRAVDAVPMGAPGSESETSAEPEAVLPGQKGEEGEEAEEEEAEEEEAEEEEIPRLNLAANQSSPESDGPAVELEWQEDGLFGLSLGPEEEADGRDNVASLAFSPGLISSVLSDNTSSASASDGEGEEAQSQSTLLEWEGEHIQPERDATANTDEVMSE